MAYYLAIDGGGTKTRCVLADETTVLARAMTGGCSVIRLGERQARESLQSAIGQVCAAARISPEQIAAVCIGATGTARPEIAAKIRSILAERVPATSAKIEVVPDTVIALDAAFGESPGVIAVAGTGSVVYGRDAAGHTARAGGWGFAISDEGSGYWIGRRAVSAILNAQDAQRETALTALVLEACKCADIDELVQQANSTPAPDFPRLFPVVLRAAEDGDGDTIAHDLLTQAGTRLASLAVLVLRRLAPRASEALPVATTGSVFRQSAEVRRVFYNQLETIFPGIEIREDFVEPVLGALARARTAGSK